MCHVATKDLLKKRKKLKREKCKSKYYQTHLFVQIIPTAESTQILKERVTLKNICV